MPRQETEEPRVSPHDFVGQQCLLDISTLIGVCGGCCWVTSHSLRSHGLQPARLFCLWNFPGKNTGVGCQFRLQGIFKTQGSNPGLLHLLHWQADSFTTEPPGKSPWYVFSLAFPKAKNMELSARKDSWHLGSLYKLSPWPWLKSHNRFFPGMCKITVPICETLIGVHCKEYSSIYSAFSWPTFSVSLADS